MTFQLAEWANNFNSPNFNTPNFKSPNFNPNARDMVKVRVRVRDRDRVRVRIKIRRVEIRRVETEPKIQAFGVALLRSVQGCKHWHSIATSLSCTYIPLNAFLKRVVLVQPVMGYLGFILLA